MPSLKSLPSLKSTSRYLIIEVGHLGEMSSKIDKSDQNPSKTIEIRRYYGFFSMFESPLKHEIFIMIQNYVTQAYSRVFSWQQ